MTSLTELVEKIRMAHNGKNGRLLVAIAAAPGAGKSTLAEALRDALAPDAQIVAMDGFHLDNETLHERGLLSRKGAPETFDVTGFTDLIRDIHDGGHPVIPAFDRGNDRVIAQGERLGDKEIIIVEGNYLLLDEPRWRELHNYWGLTIWLDVPVETLRQRLIGRWLDNGLDVQAATTRAEGNDLPNATRIIANSRQAQYIIKQ